MKPFPHSRWTTAEEPRPVKQSPRPRAPKDEDLQAHRDQEARRLADQIAADYCGLN